MYGFPTLETLLYFWKVGSLHFKLIKIKISLVTCLAFLNLGGNGMLFLKRFHRDGMS